LSAVKHSKTPERLTTAPGQMPTWMIQKSDCAQ
jgi:hypothetical protein